MHKLTIQNMKILAEKRGGKCLSNNYYDAHSKLTWQCNDGHVWEANSNKIQQGRWCPICSAGKSERICRKYFETIFNEPFPKRKLKWLVNSKGNLMELDGYCEKLGIAFEYHGPQHYKDNELFHKVRTLQQQKEDDNLKEKLCRERGIAVLVVPYSV
ncbi:MAG: hypothetical protein ABID61_02655, partial [Candidatus Micrarchaeota archaeon]